MKFLRASNAAQSYGATAHRVENDDGQFQAADHALGQRIYAVLAAHYPNHLWSIETSHKKGVVLIRLMNFTDRPWLIKIEDLKTSTGWQQVVKFGGEILERFQMPRAGFDMGHFQAANERFRPMFNRWRNPPE